MDISKIIKSKNRLDSSSSWEFGQLSIMSTLNTGCDFFGEVKEAAKKS